MPGRHIFCKFAVKMYFLGFHHTYRLHGQLLLLVLIYFTLSPLMAQNTFHISGRITDRENHEGIAFANIFIAGTTIGESSDADGNYSLTLHAYYDSLTVSVLGYELLSKPIRRLAEQTIDFSLQAEALNLKEVVVLAGENPAIPIMREVIRHKPDNDLSRFALKQYELYGKIEVDVERLPKALTDNILMKPFSFIFNNIDSTSDDRPFIPMYLTEYLAQVYDLKGQTVPKEVLISQRTSGTENQTMIDYIRKLKVPIDVYANWVYILERPIVSPFADVGLAFYEYYLIDSAMVEGFIQYKLKFKPRRKQENTFFGDFWVEDSTWAVSRVNMRLSPDANVNLVKRIVVFQDFNKYQGLWLPSKQRVIVNFQLGDKSPGVISRFTESRTQYLLDAPAIEETADKTAEDVNYGHLLKSTAYWDSVRHEPLTATEQSIYTVTDSLYRMKEFTIYKNALETLTTGYIEVGKVEFGPYFNIYSRNVAEGHRLRLGLRTTSKLSTKYRLQGYLAYGTLDRRLKYSADALWLLRSRPRTVAGIAHRRDLSLNSESSTDFQEADLASNWLRRDVPQKLIYVQESKAFVEKFYKAGTSIYGGIITRHLDPFSIGTTQGFNFGYVPKAGELDTTIRTTELLLRWRYAWGERTIDYNFDRYSMGTIYPVLTVEYTAGLPGLAGCRYNYHKVSLHWRHYFYLNPLGWLSYRARIGQVWGTAPFLLLEVHPGNEAVIMSRAVFNTMNRYEFASDRFASLILEHHFDGFFLNRLPLFRKLKWREVVSFKAVYGTLSARNRQANALNAYRPADRQTYSGFRPPDKQPYLETGVGVENIFKIIRIDALWRLNYLDNPQANRVSVVAGTYFYF